MSNKNKDEKPDNKEATEMRKYLADNGVPPSDAAHLVDSLETRGKISDDVAEYCRNPKKSEKAKDK